MPFRGHDAPDLIPAVDPFARFLVLHRCFDEDRGMFGSSTALRLSAVALVTAPGDAHALVTRVRACDAALARHFGGWFSGVDASVRLVLAAALVRADDGPAEFIADTERGRAMLREAKLQRGGVHEVLAMLALRRILAPEPIAAEHIERLAAIYREMKRHHWFLTGPEDLTACAMLVGRRGSPREIGDHVEAIYQRLAAAPKIWGGDALQTAANVLGLTALEPDEAAQRFLDVASALSDRMSIGRALYDEVAVLSFVPRPAEQIALSVANYWHMVGNELSWGEQELAKGLAANLAFVQLLSDEDGLAPLGDAKLLLDMQSVVAARQAAVTAAVVAVSS